MVIALAGVVMYLLELPWLAFLMGLLALAAAWFGGERFILGQVRIILNSTRRLTDGDLTSRRKLEHVTGELGELAHSFDRMAGSLEARARQSEIAERSLTMRAQQQTVVAALGQYALVSQDFGGMLYQAVAMVAQTPDTCPLQFEGIPTRGRNVMCLAVAGKDPRLCTGEPRTTVRATCEAMSMQDAARCDVLLPGDMPSCRRELARWRTMLAPPLSGLAKLPAARGKLIVKGEAGTPDPPTTEADLASEFARGGVVVTSRDRARVEVGMIGESETSRIAPSPNRRARLGIAVLFEPGANPKDPPKPILERIELEVPGEATLVTPSARCDCRITTARVDRTRGGELALALQGSLSAGNRTYKIDVDLATFVRDVVAEVPGGRALPPLHPTIGGGLRAGDAGR